MTVYESRYQTREIAIYITSFMAPLGVPLVLNGQGLNPKSQTPAASHPPGAGALQPAGGGHGRRRGDAQAELGPHAPRRRRVAARRSRIAGRSSGSGWTLQPPAGRRGTGGVIQETCLVEGL